MARIVAILFLLLALGCSSAHNDGSASNTGTPPGGAAPTPAASEFVCVSNGQLQLAGQPFHFAGTNNYTFLSYAADANLRPQIDAVMASADSLGLRVLRTWAFNDGSGWNSLQTAPNVYDPDVFAALDYVIDAAGRAGLKLILPLVNNWDDYGGMNQYVAWSPSASSHDDFYTDPGCKAIYKQYIADVLTRVNTINGKAYRDDPAIMAWELGNEPRCDSDPTGDTLTDWIVEMAAWLKSIDGQHLLSSGCEGFYGPADAGKNPWAWAAASGVDFRRQTALADIDLATCHLYPHGASLAATVSWLQALAADAALLGKPLILAEYGQQLPLSQRDAWFQAWGDAVYDDAAAGGAFAGACFWILYDESYPDYDGFGVYARHTSTRALLADLASRLAGL